MRPQGEPVVRSESSSGRRGRIVSKSSETTRLLCALGSWAPRLRPHEWDMAGAIEMSARTGQNKTERIFGENASDKANPQQHLATDD